MCGIAGIVRWEGEPASAADVQAMCDAMVHRGPDDEGIVASGDVALGMRRLSIIDLPTGRQPVHNEDGSVWLVFNGEIYNFKELRRDLEQRGHVFYTTSDTEVIVHLYEEYGPRLVDRLRGMFAFALWDTHGRRLLLGRDRLGIKPLFYAQIPGGIAFASEVKALLQVPEVGRTLNWPAVGHLFAFMSSPPADSVIEGIRKLEAGNIGVMTRPGALRTECYWDVQFEPDRLATESELVERLQTLLAESVSLHMRSDVPVGAFLSGGVDSSAVVAMMTRVAPGRIKTFSIGFAEDGFDELPYAREVAKAFDTDHHELVLEPAAASILEDLTWHLDEPFGDSSAIPTYMVSKLAAEHVKVVLTGDGGDEIFAGYDKYVVEGRERALDRVPAPLRHVLGAIGRSMPEGMTGRNFLRHLSLDGARRYLDASTLFGRQEQARLFHPELLPLVATGDPWQAALGHLAAANGAWLSALQYCDLHSYLPLDILTKVDRMTMAHSVEARPALLDHRLVEFAATVPPELGLQGDTTKYLFKRAMRGVLPDGIIDRPKRGFAVPLSRWFRGEWTTLVGDVLRSASCRERGVFQPQYIETLLRLHRAGRHLDHQLWTLLSFELWCRQFLDGAPTAVRNRSSREAAQARAVSA